jgi:hypothetical protein
MRTVYALWSALAVLALLTASAPVALAQSNTPPRVVFQATVPNIRLNKFPDVAAFDRTVHIVSNTNRQSAVYVSKPDTANAFSLPEVLGAAQDQGDFSPVSVATGPDGSVHVAWINIATGRIALRSKAANSSSWGPERLVYSRQSGEFLANINIGVASDGAIFVSWRVADQRMRVRRSTDGGQNWGTVFQLGERFGFGIPYIATGPGGRVAVAFMSPVGDIYEVFASVWNGSGFDTERVSGAGNDDGNPSATFGADGTLYVAYRGLAESGPNSGVFVATRSAANQYQVNRIAGPAKVFDLVAIDADPQGNLHLGWIADAGGGQQVFYSFRPNGGSFTSLVGAPNAGDAIFNLNLDANIGDQAYGHAVSELFQGDVTVLRYYLFAATSQPSIGGAPVIEDGQAISEREPNVAVRFDNIQGTPTQIRWNWDSAPTDADNDSGGWVPFTNPMSIPLPPAILASTPCSPERLFTQLREADGDTGTAQSDEIIIDTGINANIGFGNPYTKKAGQFTPARQQAELGDVGTDGASDGDPGYTRVPLYYLEIRGNNDCSGVKDLAVGRGTTSVGGAKALDKETFANVLPFPGAVTPGTNQLLVRVSDVAGNVGDFTQSIILDQGKPTLNAGGALSVTSDRAATILARLSLSGVSVADDRYPGRGFWGVWVANSRTPVANPATDPTLVWVPLKAPEGGASFEITNWSLATGLPASAVTPGTYHVYVRFLDGAGNPSDGFLTSSVTLTQVTQPRVMLPMVRRR